MGLLLLGETQRNLTVLQLIGSGFITISRFANSVFCSLSYRFSGNSSLTKCLNIRLCLIS